jgi:hypothetical protein
MSGDDEKKSSAVLTLGKGIMGGTVLAAKGVKAGAIATKDGAVATKKFNDKHEITGKAMAGVAAGVGAGTDTAFGAVDQGRAMVKEGLEGEKPPLDDADMNDLGFAFEVRLQACRNSGGHANPCGAHCPSTILCRHAIWTTAAPLTPKSWRPC